MSVDSHDVFGNEHKMDENWYCSCWQCHKWNGVEWWLTKVELQKELPLHPIAEVRG